MELEIAAFLQKDRFDLNSYLTYLFNKIEEHSSNEDKKKQEKTAAKRRN